MEEIVLVSDSVTAVVDRFGGMTTAAFRLGDKTVEPFYRNPWGTAGTADAFLAHLKGDFFCLPFGADANAQGMPSRWRTQSAPMANEYQHGYSCNGTYSVAAQSENEVELSLSYDDGDIVRVSRRIRAHAGKLTFSDTVTPARDVCLPIGCHPIFRLSEGARLVLPKAKAVLTYPCPADARSFLAPDHRADSPAAVPLADGQTLDCTRLPLSRDAEELLFLAGIDEGRAALECPAEGYRVVLEWDCAQYSSLMLWLSNRGRSAQPWSGRNLCLGLEPVTSAFDLGRGVSCAANPIAAMGVPTAHRFAANRTETFMHSVRVEALK